MNASRDPIFVILGHILGGDLETYPKIEKYFDGRAKRVDLRVRSRQSAIDLIWLASAQRINWHPQLALKHFELAGALCMPQDTRIRCASLLGRIACFVQHKTNFTAEQFLKRAEERLKELGDPAYEAYRSHFWGTILSMRGRHEESISLLSGIVTSLEQQVGGLAKTCVLAEVYNALGQAQGRIHRYDDAMESYSKALALADRVGFKLSRGRSLRGMGVIASFRKSPVDALKHFKSSLQVFEEVSFHEGIIQNCISLGRTYYSTHDFRDALFYYEKANDICERENIFSEQAEVYSRMGDVYLAQGQLAVAGEYYNADLQLVERTGDVRAKAHAMHHVGRIETLMGNAGAAEMTLQRSRATFKYVEDPINEAQVCLTLADCYLTLGKLDDARETVSFARAIFVGRGLIYECAVADLLDGVVARLAGNPGQSKTFLTQSLDFFKSEEPTLHLARTHFELGLTYQDLNDRDGFIYHIKLAVEMARHLKLRSLESDALEILSRADRSEWSRMLQTPFIGTAATEQKTQRVYITVLSADIRGYTAISRTLDVEVIAVLVNEFFDEMSKVVYGFHGIIAKFIGDCILAVFGLNQDYDPMDAIRTAQSMQAAMGRINLRNKRMYSVTLGMGIGIATGEAVAGFFGSPERLEYTVLGTTVNLASRLQANAQAGDILVDHATYQAAKGSLDGSQPSMLDLKGFDEPVQVWKVQGERLSEAFAS